jgi:hypothetical protein
MLSRNLQLELEVSISTREEVSAQLRARDGRLLSWLETGQILRFFPIIIENASRGSADGSCLVSKGLATTQKMAGQCTLAVNSFYVAPKILGQRKPLGMGTVSNIALERTIVCLEVLT